MDEQLPIHTLKNFIHTHTQSFMQNLTKNKAIALGTIPVILTIIAVLTGKALSPGVSPEASGTGPWPQEALSIVASIKDSGAQWKKAQEDVAAAEATLAAARQRSSDAELAAKGSDITLCAKFRARYDRTNKTIIADANCPLN